MFALLNVGDLECFQNSEEVCVRRFATVLSDEQYLYWISPQNKTFKGPPGNRLDDRWQRRQRPGEVSPNLLCFQPIWRLRWVCEVSLSVCQFITGWNFSERFWWLTYSLCRRSCYIDEKCQPCSWDVPADPSALEDWLCRSQLFFLKKNNMFCSSKAWNINK